MKEYLLSQLIPIINTCVVILVSIIIKLIGDSLISLLEAKCNEAIGQTQLHKYSRERALAKDVWGIVEEYFRTNNVTDDVINKKISMFNDELRKKIPYLTDEEIDFLRQVIAGEINKGKAMVSSISQKYNL